MDNYDIPIACRKGYGKPPPQSPSPWLIITLIGVAVIGVYAFLLGVNA